ncbi:hypothetical protein [Shewanella sp. CAL98-MNA-CIBAN-0140]|uniref:hypothetical protein n=1 Tax=Shewanella sp. CAL98-MNA-CIBAN-0140 TaxID=3140462 RepID=UPI00331F0155
MVFKQITLISLMLCANIFVPAHAKPLPFSDDAEFLVQACQEAVSVYKSRDEKALLAAVRTSSSEALRAGYCIGVLQQYIRQNSSCGYSRYLRSNWYPIAESIANISFGANAIDPATSSSALLERVYCDG